MTVVFSDDLGNTPAKINRYTGIIQLNNKIWHEIPEIQRRFILLHELGHYYLNTSDEKKADEYAFEHLAGKMPYSLKGILGAISENLDIENNPKHRERYLEIVKKLIQIDAEKFNNKTAQKFLKKMTTQEQINQLPEKSRVLLESMLIDFLKEKGIKDIKVLPESERAKLMIEFMSHPAVIELLAETTQMQDSFLGIGKDTTAEAVKAGEDAGKKHHSIGGMIGSIVGAGASLVAGAFGITIPPTIGASIGGMVGDALSRKHQGDSSNNTPTQQQPDPDKTAWQVASSQNTEDAYRDYLTKFPHGKYANQAKSKIQQFIDKAWQQAMSANNKEAYEAFLAKYPQSTHTQEANEKIKALKRKKTFIIGGSIATVITIIVLIVIFK